MLEEIDFNLESKVLDLGCGYGVVGILAAKIIGEDKVVMCDIDDNAVNISKNNASLNGVGNICIIKSNGVKDININDFSIILSNPPYHTDFSVAKHFIEIGFYKLVLNGRFVMVTKRFDWYKNKLTSVFGGVKVIEKNGYYIFISEKRSNIPSNKLNASEMQCYCTSCVGSCSGDCYSTCLGGCMYSCPNSCQNTCKGTCAYTCSTTCSGGCSGMNMF